MFERRIMGVEWENWVKWEDCKVQRIQLGIRLILMWNQQIYSLFCFLSIFLPEEGNERVS